MVNKRYSDEVQVKAYDELLYAIENNIATKKEEFNNIEIELCKRAMIRDYIDISCDGCLKYEKEESELDQEKREINSDIDDLEKKLNILTTKIYDSWKVEERRQTIKNT